MKPKIKAMRLVLQVSAYTNLSLAIATAAAWVLFAFSPPLAGEGRGVALTPRQAEILNLLQSLRPSDYAGGSPWMLEAWDTDVGLESVIALPTGPGNAAAEFKRLEELYEREKDSLEQGGTDSSGVEAMLAAADMASCTLTPDYYPVFDRTTAKQPDFTVLRLYLQALLRRADQLEQRGDAAKAERCYYAAIVCGWHLARDKSSALVYMTGIIFKMRGAQGFEAYLRRSGNTQRAEATKAYLDRVTEILRFFYWKANVGLSELQDFASLPTIIRIAASDKDARWRKEAITRLAVLRHGVPDAQAGVLHRNPAMERAAEEALTAVVARDPDPSVRRLAIWVTQNVSPGDNYSEHRFQE